MDPHANIEEQVKIARGIVALEDAFAGRVPPSITSSKGPYPDEVSRLAELVIAQHEWRSGGGYDPYDPAKVTG